MSTPADGAHGSAEPAPEPRPGPSRPAPAVTALLETLMRDSLDPGYAEAARRRDLDPARRASPLDPEPAERRNDRRRRGERLLAAIGALLVGLLLVVAWIQTNRSAPADARERSDLRHRVATAAHDNAELSISVRRLQSSADQLGSAALGPQDAQRLRTRELAAGTTAVQGEGVRVVIGNPTTTPSVAATGRRGTTGLSSVSLLTDTDVRAVVNELWTDGAEAIAVNGVRLTPTSAIRFAGQAVLVDFRPVTAPYTISVIGPADQLNTDFTASGVAERFRTLASAYGFAFTVDQEKTVDLPASAGGGPRYARTVPGPSTPGATPAAPPTSRSAPVSSSNPASGTASSTVSSTVSMTGPTS